MSSLDLFQRVLGARVSVLAEGAGLEGLVEKAMSGEEYRVSATSNHCDHPSGENERTFLLFPFDSKMSVSVVKTVHN